MKEVWIFWVIFSLLVKWKMRKESTECSFSRSSWGKEPALNPINLAAQRSSRDFNESDREDQLAQRRHQTPEEWSVHWCCGRCQPLDVPTRYFLLLFKKFTPPPWCYGGPFFDPPPQGGAKAHPTPPYFSAGALKWPLSRDWPAPKADPTSIWLSSKFLHWAEKTK